MNAAAAPLFALVARMGEDPACEDESLLERAQRGERRAFDQLYQRHVNAVYGRLTRLVGPSSELEDLVQRTFIELYRALPSFRGEAPLGAFIHGIAVRVGYDYLRKRARSRQSHWDEAAVLDLVAPGSSPEAAAHERQELKLAFGRLDRLKPKKRVAFVLHVIEGIPLEEMSRMLSVDARTLGQRVAYARRELLEMVLREESRCSARGGAR